MREALEEGPEPYYHTAEDAPPSYLPGHAPPSPISGTKRLGAGTSQALARGGGRGEQARAGHAPQLERETPTRCRERDPSLRRLIEWLRRV